jgi:capsular exopolysaccharide synthesis family protein
MAGPLPIGSYLFILRKHRWLVLGTVVTVLGAGYFQGKSQKPVYQAKAQIQIQPKLATASVPGTAGVVVPQDPLFVNDQIVTLKSDDALAARVKAHLLGEDAPPPGAPPRAPAPGPQEPPIPSPEPFRALDPRSMPSMIAVTPVPATTYFDLSVKGPDPVTPVAIVNAYARIFAEHVARERAGQFDAVLADYGARREAAKRRLEEAGNAIAAFKTRHPQVDFEKDAFAAERESVDNLKKLLTPERVRLISLERELVTVTRALKGVRLELKDRGEEGFSLEPPVAEEVENDPRLSERIQALDVVARSEGVRRAFAALESLLEEERAILKRLAPSTDEVKAIRERIRAARFSVARGTDAALVKLAAERVERAEVVKAWDAEVLKLEATIGGASAARAEYEVLQKAERAVESDLQALDVFVHDAETQRNRAAEGFGAVNVKRYARPGEAAMVAPSTSVVYLTAAVVALLLAAALAYVLEYLDDTVKTREDFDRLVRLPFLGFVPHIKANGAHTPEFTVARGRTGTPEVEAFRAIRTGIQFSLGDRRVRTLLLTSAAPGEGKTTISVNLAAAFAGGKGRVLLVDADLRRARVHSAIGVDNSRGLTNVLVGDMPLAAAVQASSIEGIDVLASGPIPPNPAEVLGSVRMREVLKEAEATYARVIVDSPPLVAVTDPALLAKYVDGVFLVISIGKTSVRSIQRARETLAAAGAKVDGAILNNADLRLSGYSESYGGYGYGYGYGYASAGGDGKGTKAPAAGPAA